MISHALSESSKRVIGNDIIFSNIQGKCILRFVQPKLARLVSVETPSAVQQSHNISIYLTKVFALKLIVDNVTYSWNLSPQRITYKSFLVSAVGVSRYLIMLSITKTPAIKCFISFGINKQISLKRSRISVKFNLAFILNRQFSAFRPDPRHHLRPRRCFLKDDSSGVELRILIAQWHFAKLTQLRSVYVRLCTRCGDWIAEARFGLFL